jgi:hypothetical protein
MQPVDRTQTLLRAQGESVAKVLALFQVTDVVSLGLRAGVHSRRPAAVQPAVSDVVDARSAVGVTLAKRDREQVPALVVVRELQHGAPLSARRWQVDFQAPVQVGPVAMIALARVQLAASDTVPLKLLTSRNQDALASSRCVPVVLVEFGVADLHPEGAWRGWRGHEA